MREPRRKNYFLNYYYLRNNLSIRLANGNVDVHDGGREDWLVHLVDTGLHTQTGGRIKRLTRWLAAIMISTIVCNLKNMGRIYSGQK